MGKITTMQKKIFAFSSAAIAVAVMVLFAQGSYCHAGNNQKDENALIQKIIAAHGGRENLSKVRAMSALGHIKKLFPFDEGPYFRVMKRERKLFVDIKYSRFEEKRILNSKKGYRATGRDIEEVTGPPYDAMVYQYNQLDLPFGLLDGSFSVISQRKENIDGREAEVLQLKDHFGYAIDVYVNPDDSMILKVIGYFQTGDSRRSLGAEFSDYKAVEGILLPSKIINYANDFKLSETDIMKYKINPQIDEDIFTP